MPKVKDKSKSKGSPPCPETKESHIQVDSDPCTHDIIDNYSQSDVPSDGSNEMLQDCILIDIENHSACAPHNSDKEAGCSHWNATSNISDTEISKTKKTKGRWHERYSNDPKYREKEKQRARERYRTNMAYRKAHFKRVTANRDKHCMDKAHMNRMQSQANAKTKHRYQTDNSYKKAKKLQDKAAAKHGYDTNEAHKMAKKNKDKARNKSRYDTDNVHKMAKKNKDKARNKGRYDTDNVHKMAKKNKDKARNKSRYDTDTAYVTRRKKSVNGSQKQKYHTNEAYRNMTIRKSEQLRDRQNVQKADFDIANGKFQKTCKEAPCHICCSCLRILFRQQVHYCHEVSYKNRTIANEAITKKYLHECSDECKQECDVANSPRGRLWICFTCHRHNIANGKLPPESNANGLELDDIPDVLSSTNVLEKQLIALRIAFGKFVNLPSGSQRGVRGPIVNVPADIEHTIDTLPRPIHDAQIISVKLKRKLTYKSFCEFKLVDVTKLQMCLAILKDMNPLYKCKMCRVEGVVGTQSHMDSQRTTGFHNLL